MGASANSQVDPSVRGNQLVPEGLADPEMDESILSFTSGKFGHISKDKGTVQWYLPSPREVLVGHRFLSYPNKKKKHKKTLKV